MQHKRHSFRFKLLWISFQLFVSRGGSHRHQWAQIRLPLVMQLLHDAFWEFLYCRSGVSRELSKEASISLTHCAADIMDRVHSSKEARSGTGPLCWQQSLDGVWMDESAVQSGTCALAGFNLTGSSTTSSRAAVMWTSAAQHASEVQPAPKPVFPWFHS